MSDSGLTTQGGGRLVRSLTDLPKDVAPVRDLWPAIAAAIESDRAAAQPARRGGFGLRFAAGLAASVGLVAVGVWVGARMPVEAPATTAALANVTAPEAIAAAFAANPRLAAERTRLLGEAEKKLAELPAADRERVAASLAAIRRSMTEIEAALGREPTNALLQELLVTTTQDELRVLSALAEARQEI
jgi:hypothetical protein